MKQTIASDLPSPLDVIAQQLLSLRFGVVQITVHDSKVVQIERTERIRLDPGTPPKSNRNTVQSTGGNQILSRP